MKKKNSHSLMADDWGGGAGFSLAFVVAVTSVLSDLVR